MTSPAPAALAACRDDFVRTVYELTVDEVRDATLAAHSGGDPVTYTLKDVLPESIGWALNDTVCPRRFAEQLPAADAASLTKSLRAVAGTPPTGCCGGIAAPGCHGCPGLEATAAHSPAELFDTALAVLSWTTAGEAETQGPQASNS